MFRGKAAPALTEQHLRLLEPDLFGVIAMVVYGRVPYRRGARTGCGPESGRRKALWSGSERPGG